MPDRRNHHGTVSRHTNRGLVAVGIALAIGPSILDVEPANGGAPKCFGRRATIVGTDGPNRIRGTQGTDVIVARRGSDVIDGFGGRDFICAGPGRDFVFGGSGNDRIKAGDGGDYMAGGPGSDLLNGGAGFDYVDYATADEGIVADTGLDRVRGQGADSIPAVEGILGTSKADTMTGSDGPEDFFGARGRDTLAGGAGDDVIAGGRGVDVLDGGAGTADLVEFFDAAGGVQVDLAANSVAGAESDSIVGFEGATGSTFDDVITGTDAANGIFGGYGDDELRGRAGDDLIEGRGHDDFMAGDAGNDTLDGGPGTDGADGGEGTDSCVAETTVNCESRRAPSVFSRVQSLREAVRAGRLQGLLR